MGKESVITVKGKFSLRSGRELFEEVKQRLGAETTSIVLDLEGVDSIDSLGGAWLVRIKKYTMTRSVRFEYRGAKGTVAEYLKFISPGLKHIGEKPPVPPGLFEGIGSTFFEAAREIREAFELGIDAIYWTFIAPVEGRKLRWASLMDELHEIGVRAIGIVVLINYLLGFVIAMLAAAQVRKFGAGIYVADLVVIGFARELAPIMTAIIISARSGAAISAEMATMKVQEEIDALKGMGFSVARFLIAPKIVAMLFAMPCLVLLGMVAGVWGGLHVGTFILGLDSGQWIRETFASVVVGDVIQGLIKSIVFAFIIVMVGCHNGLRVTGGARGVGLATTRSVVMDIFFIIVLDVVFATLFYYTF